MPASSRRLLLLSRYDRLGASSRLRHGQYLPALTAAGFTVDCCPFFTDAYLEAFYAGRRPSLRSVFAAYVRRLAMLRRARTYDLVWLEKEFLPWCPALCEQMLYPADVPYVVDYDDAWFHRYDQHRRGVVRQLLGEKIARIMRRAALVVAGNSYLADYACAAGAGWVEILPTVLDPARYDPTPPPADGRFMIGWIGTPHTARYLTPLAPVLAAVCAEGRATVRLIGGTAEALPGVPVEVRPWHEASEAAELAACTVGLMPLPDAPFERGKCGYKLIQCMATGRPVIASPVGVNRQLVDEGVTGFLATRPEDWFHALIRLRDTPELVRRMGAAGRAVVESRYALAVTAPRLVSWLERLCPHLVSEL